jgi:hypothetical protein
VSDNERPDLAATLMGMRTQFTKAIATLAVVLYSLTSCTSADDAIESIATSLPPSSTRSIESTAALTSTAGETPSFVETSGWTEQPIGTLSAGQVDVMAFAPDGKAVAFSTVDTSCCSVAVTGWARTATGSWASIENMQETFVQGPEGGPIGGPVDVSWFNDKFIAIGTRGGSAELQGDGTPVVPESVAWTSTDGLTWSVANAALSPAPVALAESVDGSSLVGLWGGGEELAIRSTVDGSVWTTPRTITTPQEGSYLFANNITLVSSVLSGSAVRQQIITGNLSPADGSGPLAGFVSISEDGLTWETSVLPSSDSKRSFAATSTALFDGRLVVYGYSYDESNVGVSQTTAVGWASIDGGKTFESIPLTNVCNGSFSSIAVDQASPESRLFAICAVTVEPTEGDYVETTDQLLMTGDGSTFEVAPTTSGEWNTPSVDIGIGPVTSDNGVIVLGVTKAGTDGTRVASVWRS